MASSSRRFSGVCPDGMRTMLARVNAGEVCPGTLMIAVSPFQSCAWTSALARSSSRHRSRESWLAAASISGVRWVRSRWSTDAFAATSTRAVETEFRLTAGSMSRRHKVSTASLLMCTPWERSHRRISTVLPKTTASSKRNASWSRSSSSFTPKRGGAPLAAQNFAWASSSSR